MSNGFRQLRSVWILVSLFFPAAGMAGLKCHLHAPSSTNPEIAKQVLAVTRSEEECHQENLTQFSGKGWCHCGFGSMPVKRSPFENKIESSGSGPDSLMR